jgi:serine/threonine-protein kinase
VGSFRIEEEIAAGAVARIYAVSEPGSGFRLALKVLSAHFGLLPEARRRFEAEYELARRVAHPGIIPVYERGCDAGYWFYSMRLESSRTVAALKGRGESDSRDGFYLRLAALFAQAAASLEALHRNGIVHRDVKPDNLLLGRDGGLVLCDFGSALDARHRDPALADGLWGTVRYMSPEQFRPDADPYDPASDIYALGVTLYEVATGVSPFPRTTEHELVRWKLSRLPPAPRRVRPDLPLGLDALIRRAMEPNRSLRFQSAGELALELDRFALAKRGSRRSLREE